MNYSDIDNMMRDFARQAGFNFGFNPMQQQDFYEEILCPVTIKNLYNEEEIPVSFNVFEKNEIAGCQECGGTGQKVHTERHGGMILNRATICHKCQGRGFTTTGIGTNKEYKITASINNLGRPRPLGKVGSYNPVTNDYNQVLVRLDLQKSLNYSLVENGVGLMMVLPVLYEHLKDGKKLKIKVFDNNVVVDIPPKPSLQRMLTVPGKGMPFGNGRRGNLYVKLDLKYEE
jgi:DnaJ-class molecular chaperone